MRPDRVSNPVPPTSQSGALPTALRAPENTGGGGGARKKNVSDEIKYFLFQLHSELWDPV